MASGVPCRLRTVLGHYLVGGCSSAERDTRRVGVVRRDGYERQEWSIRTEPGMQVPFYLLLPSDRDPPYPIVITVHGHNETGKELAVGKYCDERQHEEITQQRRDMALQAVERGYAAIALDMRAFGSLADSKPQADGQRACTRMQKNAQLYGRSLVGECVWDVLRLVDFVERRPTLDADRVGITGHSGGGAVTLLVAVLDDRLAPVAPNPYFCTFEDSILAIDHCACNYVPGLLRLGEMCDLAGLVAPRPLVVTTGKRTPSSPWRRHAARSTHSKTSTGRPTRRTDVNCTSATADTSSSPTASGRSLSGTSDGGGNGGG